jgi:plastocyanin
MYRSFGAILAVTGALVSSSCGGGSGAPAAPSPGPGGGGGGSTTVTITITGVKGVQSFSPNPGTCAAGQMVVWRNADVVTHRVKIDDLAIDTGDIAPGASSQPMSLGNVSKSYHCPIHPSMVGSLNAAQTPDPPPCTGYCG